MKRKPSLESLACTPSKKAAGNKKKRSSKDAEVVDNTPPTAPAPAVSISKSNFQSPALLNSREDSAQERSNTAGTAKATSPITTIYTTSEIMLPSCPNKFRASNPINSSSGNPSPKNRTRSSTHDKITGQLKDTHNQPEINGSNPNQGNLHTPTTLKLNPVATKDPGGNEKAGTTKRKSLLVVTNQQKSGSPLSVQGSISVHRSSLDTLRPSKADGRRFSGLFIASSSGIRYHEKDNPSVVAPVENRKTLIGPSEEEPHPNIKHPEKDSTVRPPVRGFKRLKLRIKSTMDSNNAIIPSSSFTPPAIQKHDDEILASIIRNPPRYSFRKEVERIARVLALVAFYSCSFEDSTAPGYFLKHLALVSRKYRYASTLAFTNLVKLEFRGKRTQNWFKNKGIDEKVADVRSWYWHRVSERASIVERVSTSWMERVWRFLVLASEMIKPSTVVGSSKPMRFGLWFSGINKHLITDPDFIGQFETSIRFWIRRFYVWITRNGGGYPLLLQDLRDEMIQNIQPLVETENQDLWRVETKCGDVHFIVGLTGEVIGRVEVDNSEESSLNPVLRRARTRIGTIIRSRTRASRLYSQINERKHTNIDPVTWKDLREDWKEHALALVSPSTTPEELSTSSRRLIESVYRPDSKMVSNGIHESIKLPHHRALAERWVLAQVEPGGISGKPVLDVFHSPMHRKKKLGLDLQAKLIVESVRCSGEKWISSMNGYLAQGVGFVHTPGMGWFVLEETGQNIAQEDYGIQGLWATVLGVNEDGSALSSSALEGLAEMFVMKDTLDYM
ncbi:hypothetical protein DFP73DRAFT_594854 [Morchella snyderi]|nr:hypothetical protein DFP73DRAFT_594854 [Morchella snyderi]